MYTENFFVEAARKHLLSTATGQEWWKIHFSHHLPQVERWANWLLNKHSEANPEVVLLGVWLHDIGQMIGPSEIDHAINSETEVRRFLPILEVESELIDQVAHCVRSHRCRDILPQTIEAKILAAADSASHITDQVYINMANRGEISQALAKLDRDLRDVQAFPELVEELTPAAQGWIILLNSWPETLNNRGNL